MFVRLESIRPEENRFRRYVVIVGRTLWGSYGVRCEWGRIGERSPRGVTLRECTNRDDALALAAEAIELRMRHGYRIKITAQRARLWPFAEAARRNMS